MKRRYLIFTIVSLLIAALTFSLSGCDGGGDSIEGKNVVTFEMNGGILNYGTSSTSGRINYAYYPNTLIKDPTQFSNYSLTRNGYVFTGWYTDKECTPGKEWDFNTYFTQETLTLYAGWEVEIKFTFSVNYVDGDETVSLGKNKVNPGDKFEDWRKYAEKREGYTGMGYYSDPECTIPWDYDFAHPGGDSDLDIPVYVKYIEGEWKLVSNFAELKSALSSGNVYLMNDIDCGGADFGAYEFNKIFEGNGYKVTNFTVSKTGTNRRPAIAIFKTLGDKADIRNVSFENVTYSFKKEGTTTPTEIKVAALTVDMAAGAKVTNVSVSGVLNTNHDDNFAHLNDVFYYKDGGDTSALTGVTNFNANITVNKQS